MSLQLINVKVPTLKELAMGKFYRLLAHYLY
jgi:hypothetical protein